MPLLMTPPPGTSVPGALVPGGAQPGFPDAAQYGGYVTLDDNQVITGVKTFTGPGDNNTGSLGHWLGSVITNDITIYPNPDVSTSASMFLDNGAGQVYEFYSDVSGSFGVFDKTAGHQILLLTDAAGGHTVQYYGGILLPVTTVTSNYTAGVSDSTILCNGALTVTLPGAQFIQGRTYTVKNIGTSSVTVAAGGTDTIDGAGTKTLGSQYKYVTVQSDDVNGWFVIANN